MKLMMVVSDCVETQWGINVAWEKQKDVCTTIEGNYPTKDASTLSDISLETN